MSLSEEIRQIRAEVFADLGEFLLIGSIRVPGKFYRRYREVGFSDGQFVGVDLSFDAQLVDDALAEASGFDANVAAITALEQGDSVGVVAVAADGETERDLGTFRFMRRLPKAGDETGLIVLELAYS